jgi:hypothetical protein
LLLLLLLTGFPLLFNLAWASASAA